MGERLYNVGEKANDLAGRVTAKGCQLLDQLGITTFASCEYDACPDMSPEHFLIRLLSWRGLRDAFGRYNAKIKQEEEKVILTEVLGAAYVYAQGIRQSKRMN